MALQSLTGNAGHDPQSGALTVRCVAGLYASRCQNGHHHPRWKLGIDGSYLADKERISTKCRVVDGKSGAEGSYEACL